MTLFQLALFALGIIGTLVLHDLIGHKKNSDIGIKLAVIALIFIAGLYASGHLLSFALGAAITTAGITTYSFAKRIADKQRHKEAETKKFNAEIRKKLELDQN